MLTVVRSIAVVDRTGALQRALRGVDADVYELRTTELDAAPPDVDVLLLGAHELSTSGLRRLARWRRVQPAGVAVVHANGSNVDRSLLRAHGADHVMRGPATPAKVRTALLHADVALAELVQAAGRLHVDDYDDIDEPDVDEALAEDVEDALAEIDFTPDADTDDLDDAEPATLARLITIASATGGCGKTFYATNVASLLAGGGARVLVVDLDLQFGEVAAALQVHHPYSLYDGLYGTSGERLPASTMREHLDELVHHHPLGFDVLTAPRDPVLADYVGARDAMTMLDAVLPRYDVVIADTPPSLNDVVIAALDRSDAVCVLATLDVPSLRNLTSFLDVLKRLELDESKVRLLLNKADRDVGVTAAEANDAFGGRFTSVLPVDRAVSRSVNLGTTVVVHEPKAKVSRAITPSVEALARDLGLAVAPTPTAAPSASASDWFRSLGARWRRLLPGGSA